MRRHVRRADREVFFWARHAPVLSVPKRIGSLALKPKCASFFCLGCDLIHTRAVVQASIDADHGHTVRVAYIVQGVFV